MVQEITTQFEDFYVFPLELETTYSSGESKSAKPICVPVSSLKSMHVQAEKVSNTLQDNLEINNSINDMYESKEKEWHKLIGKERFQSLDKKSRDFLINTAGAISFGTAINIKQTYQYTSDDE